MSRVAREHYVLNHANLTAMAIPDNTHDHDNIRLIVSDMDGTLLAPDKSISPETLRVISQLKKAGIRICLVSSRPPGGMEMYFKTLHLHSAYGALNGGTIFAPDGQVISSLTLPSHIAHKAISTLLAYNIQPWLFRGHDWLVPEGDNPLIMEESEELQMKPIILSSYEGQHRGLAKISGCSSDNARLMRAHIALQRELSGVASVSQSHHTLLDITPLHANKGYALQHLARYYALPISRVCAIGDMDNDIPMLDIAGLSIAMGQAKAHVKAHARLATLSDGENGWAYAMQNYLLNPQATLENRS